LEELRLGVVASSELAVETVLAAERAEVVLVVVAARLAVTMPPVKPAMAAMLSHPARRRAPRAGCGRFRRWGAVADIGHSRVVWSIPASSRRVSGPLETVKKRARSG